MFCSNYTVHTPFESFPTKPLWEKVLSSLLSKLAAWNIAWNCTPPTPTGLAYSSHEQPFSAFVRCRRFHRLSQVAHCPNEIACNFSCQPAADGFAHFSLVIKVYISAFPLSSSPSRPFINHKRELEIFNLEYWVKCMKPSLLCGWRHRQQRQTESWSFLFHILSLGRVGCKIRSKRWNSVETLWKKKSVQSLYKSETVIIVSSTRSKSTLDLMIEILWLKSLFLWNIVVVDPQAFDTPKYPKYTEWRWIHARKCLRLSLRVFGFPRES